MISAHIKARLKAGTKLNVIVIGDQTTTTEMNDDDYMVCQVTSCCKIGPITNENYCPNCGKEIISK